MNDFKGTILLVDDDTAFRQAASRALNRRGFTIAEAQNGEEALQHESLADCDAAVIDLRMPGMNGLELLTNLREKHPQLPVLVLTGHGSISTAIEAIKIGAFHYLTKPCDMAELVLYLQKAIDQRQLKNENQYWRSSVQKQTYEHGIVGNSPAIKSLLTLIDRMKDSEAPILISGESGTGKELVARALHYQSKRHENPFVAINCATLKPELLENELFGHVSGAFTGAVSRKEGLLSVANEGTLFIDEIADMNPNVQASLLRVIETGEFRPLGSTKIRSTKTRIVAAVNRDLQQQVEAGSFRQDLFYRLNVLVIHTPPLRDHKEDIPILVQHFLEHHTSENSTVRFDDDALAILQEYDWPGNIRELFNICERVLILRDEDVIRAEQIIPMLSLMSRPPQSQEASTASPNVQTLDEMERHYIQQVLRSEKNNVTKTAERLGIDRRTLQRKMKRFDL